MKYYNSYIIKDENLLSENNVNSLNLIYRVYYSADFKCNVAERLNSGIVDWVIYYLNNPITEIIEYHNKKLDSSKRFSFYKVLTNNNYKLTNYYEDYLTGYFIKTYHEDGKPNLRQEFNKDFELVEYCQSIYNAEGNLIQEKIFYADSWTIHTEKMML